MQQLSEFVVNHWVLVTAFCAVAGLLVSSLVHGAGGVAPHEAVRLMNREGAQVLDIRPASEFEQGHITGAVNIPQAELEQAVERLRRYRDKPVLVCCASGNTAGAAVRRLRGMGFAQARAIAGGVSAWRGANLPLTAG